MISSVKSIPVSPVISCSSRSSQNCGSIFPEEKSLAIPPLHFSRTPLSFSRNFANSAMRLPASKPAHKYELVAVLPCSGVLSTP